MNFSFVIPTYNHFHLLHQVLYDIYQRCPPVLEVVVVDDGSADQDYHDGLKWWNQNGLLPLRVVKKSENTGFLKTSNAGLKRAKGDVICLLSNDVRIYKDIGTPLLQMFEQNEKQLVGARLIDWNSGWNTFGGVTFPYIEGWLLTMTSDGWKDVGYFDEEFAPYDFEDVDLSTQALSCGYSLNIIPDGYVQHLGGQSIGFNSVREEQTKRNQRKFEKKWVKKGKAS